MLIHSLEIKNFKQYLGVHRVDLSVDAGSNQNIVLIGGLNGAGKTTIFQAIRLGLFGKENTDLWEDISYKTFIRKSLCIYALEEREFSIRINLQIGDTQAVTALTIERKWRFNESLDFSSESLKVFENEKEKIGLSTEELELYIQERLPYGVSQFVFFDGEKVHELAQVEAIPSQTQDAIRNILGLKLYQELEQDLWLYERNLLRENTDSEEFRFAENALKRNHEQLESLQEHKNILISNLTEVQEELKDIQEKRKHLGNRQLKNIWEMDELLESLKNQRDVLKKELSDLVAKDLPLIVLRPVLYQLQEQLGTEAKMTHEKITRQQIETHKVEFIEGLFGEKYSQDVVNRFEKVYKTIFPATEKERILHRNISIEQKYALIEQIKSMESQAVRHIDKILKELELVDFKIRKIYQEKRALPSDAEYMLLENKEQDLLDNMRVLSEQIGAISIEEKRLEHERAVVERNFEAVSRKVELSKDIRVKADKAQIIRECVREFINQLSAEKIFEVQRYLTHMFNRLTWKSDSGREFIIDATSYAIRVLDNNNKSMDLRDLSAGEKELFAISFLWALGKAAVAELPLVIDTPLGRLDSMHQVHIAERFFPEANRQVIILSTDTEIDATLYTKLRPLIAKEYRLIFDQTKNVTSIKTGYFFEDVEVATIVHKAI